MKQIGKKFFAIAMTTVMVLQLVAGLIPSAKQVEATDTTNDTSSEWDYEINFENADVKKLTDFTSTKFDNANNYGIVEQDKTIYDHWYTGTADTDTYGRETGYKTAGVSWSSGNRSAGLKALTGYGTTYRYLATYTGAQYENFEVVSEIHSNLAKDGIAFGQENVFPASKDSTSARVYFNGSNSGGRLALEGAFDYTSYKVTGNEEDTTNLGFSTKTNVFTFHNAGLSRGQMFELHIKKEGTKVTIWVEGYSPVLTIELASAWVDGPVALCTNGTAPGGGFKSFAVKGWAYDNFNFENADVKKLTDFTSTKFDRANNYGIVEQDKTIYDHWYTGTADTDTYGRETGYKTAGVSWSSGNRSAGLKALTGYGTTYRYLATYTGAQYENFEVVSEIHSNLASDGIAFGEKNVFPASSDSTSAGVYFTGSNTAGRLQLEGAFDYKRCEVTGRGSDTTLGFNTNTNVFTFHNAGLSRGQMFELHIKKEGTKVTIWVEGYSPVLTIELADTWVVGPVSLYTKGTAPGGGFKSFTIRGKGLQSIDFGKISAKNIIDFTSTKFDSANGYEIVEQDKTVYAHWYTGTEKTDEYGRPTGYEDQNVSTSAGNRSAGLKALTGYGKSYRYLATYTGAQYENFEVTAEIHSNLATDGIAFGEKNVFPLSDDSSSARVYFAGSEKAVRVFLNGAFDYKSWKQTGTGGDIGYNTNTNAFTFATSETAHRGKMVELHVKKEGSKVTIWAEGYEAVLTIELASTWKSGPVALCSNGTAPGGGFNSFAIEELKNVPTPGNLVNADLSKVTEFTSTKVDVNNNYTIVDGEVDKPVSEHWFTGRDTTEYPKYETNTAYRNSGLKPKMNSADGYMSYFTYNGKTSNNFETSVSYYKNYIGYGLIIGQKNIYPQTLDSAGVRLNIHTQGGAYYLAITGAIDTPTAVSTGINDASITAERERVLLRLDGYKITHNSSDLANSDLANKVITTIHAKVNNGQLIASVDNLGFEVTVNLNGAYVNDVVSLYSTGANQGGFDDFTISDLEVTKPRESVTLTYTMETIGEFAVVTLNTDAGYSKIDGTLKFDSNVYEYVGATFAGDNFCINTRHKPELNAEGIVLSSFANADSKVVSIYFKTKNNIVASDFSGFKLKGEETVVILGGTTAITSRAMNLKNDYNEDEFVNIVDLVVAKQGETEETIVTTQELRKVLVGSNDSVSPLLGKTVLSLGDSIVKGDRDAFGMSWVGRVAMEGALDENVGQNGWALTNKTVSGRGGAIVQQLNSAKRDSYDFVLLEGAVNDVLEMQDGNKNITWGEPTDQIGGEYDTTTIAGAMQDLVVKTKAKFPKAKIIYIINSYYGATDENMTKHKQTVKTVCDIHSIDYVDFSDTIKYSELSVLAPDAYENISELYNAYLPDGLHPNSASYDLTTPRIIEVMEGLVSRNQ